MTVETRPAARALMACLGEHSRFRLVQALIPGPRCVTDLAAEVGLSQSCTTRHLQALERGSVVRRSREGKRVLYRIRDDQPDLVPLLGWALRVHGSGTGAGRRLATPGAVRRRPGPDAVSDLAPPAARTPAPSPTERKTLARPATSPVRAASTPRDGAPMTRLGAPLDRAPGPGPDDPPKPTSTTRLDPPPPAGRRNASDLEDFLL
jgi:DNA-binding transcriptional ArsR family regulator